MYLFEKRIDLKNQEELQEYLSGYCYGTSGLCFTGLYMWRESNQFSYQIIGEYLCIAAVSHLEIGEKELYFMFPPLTKTGQYDKDSLRYTILTARRLFEEKGADFSLRLVPGHMLELIKEAVPEISFYEDRPNFDYIYSREELEHLRGKKYHAKKNYVNSFRKNYEYEYQLITSDMEEEIMEYIADFNRKKELPEHEMELLKLEEEAMRDVFHNFEAAGYFGGLIRINGKIEALTAGGRACRSFVQHIEKANTEFRGLYPMIMNELIRSLPEDIEFINREEDMDMENLRKAKLSYHPVKLLDKYIGTFEQG